jgi:hypothetical protein
MTDVGGMKDWRFALFGLLWLAFGIALLVWPKQMQAASKRFEQRESVIPCPPLVGVPIWAVRLFGIVVLSGAAFFFDMFLA